MNISLTPELEKLVQRKVASGLYSSASEVIREALRLFDDENRIFQAKLKSLKQDIALGIKQADCGDTLDGHEAFARLRRRTKPF